MIIFAFLRELGGMISVKLFSLFYRAYKPEIIWQLSLFAFFKCNGGGLIRRVEEGKGVYHRSVHFSRRHNLTI